MDERVCINKYWFNFAKIEINLLNKTKVSVKIYAYSEIFSNFSAFLLLRLYPFRKNGSKLNDFAYLKNSSFSQNLWKIDLSFSFKNANM